MGKVQHLKNSRKSKKPTVKGIPSKKKHQTKNVIKTTSKKLHTTRKKKNGRKQREKRGVVYLSHIPHGFYEDQIEAYFKQFGAVTAVSVPRSKTGEAKGYAFIEFSFPEVAEIAAETMNNYLMFNRVLKAKYIPPAEQKPKFFMTAKEQRQNHKTSADRAELRIKHQRMLKNRLLSSKAETKMAAKLLRREKLIKHTIEKMGLDYEIQVQRGNIETVFKQRKSVLEDKKKRKQALADKEKEKTISDNTTSENDEDVSAESDNDNNKSEKEETVITVKNLTSGKKSKPKKKSSPSKSNPAQILTTTKDKLTTNEIGIRAASSLIYEQNDEYQQSNKLPLKTSVKKQNKLPEKGAKKSSKTKSKNQQVPHENKEASLLLKTPELNINKATISKQSKKYENLVMEVDEDDDEISFKTPPNVTKKIINIKKASAKKSPKEQKLSLNTSKVSLSAFKSSFPRKSRHCN